MEVWHAGAPVRLARRQQRLILGIFALRANELVSSNQLIDLLWGDSPPRQARAVVQTRVSELRAVLNGSADAAVRLRTRGGGYLLESAPEAIDAQHFLTLVRASRAERDGTAAIRTLRRALDLWRGPVLGGDVPNELCATLCQGLESARLTATEELFDLELGLGNQQRIVDELLATARVNPARERLVGQLMLALTRVGRSAEALSYYDEWRRWLADEFGVDPQPDVQRLHLSILREGEGEPPADPPDDTLPVGVADQSGVAFRGGVPRLLPPDVSDFTGRTTEIDRIRRLLTAPTRTGVAVVAVTGPGGVGKTALSVHVAHTLQGDFPDGQMYANLRGPDHRTPIDPSEVLGRFLRALGVDGAAVPETIEERADLYRDLLAERRVLVVLDNAASDEQIAPLVPAGRRCAVIINGRTHLGSTFGAPALRLEIFEPGQAVELLGHVAGTARLQAEPDAAAELCRQCGFLPLALRVLGARLAAKPHWSVAKLSGMLRDESGRLDQFSYHELDVRASLAISYAGLSPAAQRLLRLTGHVDLAYTDSWIAAALLDVSAAQGESLLEELFDGQLVDVAEADPVSGSRFRLHHLVRLFARERADVEDDSDELTAARIRVFGAWLSMADGAYRAIHGGPYQTVRVSVERYAVDDAQRIRPAEEPVTWFESERAALAVVARRAAQEGHAAACWELVNITSPLFQMRRYFTEWHELIVLALDAAQAAGDRLGEATMLYRLAMHSTDRREFGRAEEYIARSLELFATTGSLHGRALVNAFAASLSRIKGHEREALVRYKEVLPELVDARDWSSAALALRGIGQIHLNQHDHSTADHYFGQALDMCRLGGSTRLEAQVLFWQGMLRVRQERFTEAEPLFSRVLSASRQLGDLTGEGQALHGLSLCYQGRGQVERARVTLHTALVLCRQPRPTLLEGTIRRALADLESATGGRNRSTVPIDADTHPRVD
ncbi:AfsR/SARP family transcriptional regulator [Micromonospora echinospora]|uniref:AfsR/SARP family transcriptional regulator n=1 Tax=Micromonospora echinospora TaxID=1877 RepID=UPI0037A2422A